MSTTAPVTPLRLRPYQSEHLELSPLVLVAVQINFEEISKAVTHPQARGVQKLLGAEWTQLQHAPQTRATLTPAGLVTDPQRSAYRLQSTDQKWSLMLNPDSVTLETQAYEGWENMANKIENLASAVAEVFDPSQCQRLGLRYIDQIKLPAGHSNWDGLIPPTILGLVGDPDFGKSVVGSDQRSMLQLRGARCMFHHGLLTEPEGAYLLDYDVFDESPQMFAAKQLAATASALHEHAGALFRASVTDALYEVLKGKREK